MYPVYRPQVLVEFETLGVVFSKWEDLGLYKDPQTAYSKMYQAKINENRETQMEIDWVPGNIKVEFTEDKENE